MRPRSDPEAGTPTNPSVSIRSSENTSLQEASPAPNQKKANNDSEEINAQFSPIEDPDTGPKSVLNESESKPSDSNQEQDLCAKDDTNEQELSRDCQKEQTSNQGEAHSIEDSVGSEPKKGILPVDQKLDQETPKPDSFAAEIVEVTTEAQVQGFLGEIVDQTSEIIETQEVELIVEEVVDQVVIETEDSKQVIADVVNEIVDEVSEVVGHQDLDDSTHSVIIHEDEEVYQTEEVLEDEVELEQLSPDATLELPNLDSRMGNLEDPDQTHSPRPQNQSHSSENETFGSPQPMEVQIEDCDQIGKLLTPNQRESQEEFPQDISEIRPLTHQGETPQKKLPDPTHDSIDDEMPRFTPSPDQAERRKPQRLPAGKKGENKERKVSQEMAKLNPKLKELFYSPLNASKKTAGDVINNTPVYIRKAQEKKTKLLSYKEMYLTSKPPRNKSKDDGGLGMLSAAGSKGRRALGITSHKKLEPRSHTVAANKLTFANSKSSNDLVGYMNLKSKPERDQPLESKDVKKSLMRKNLKPLFVSYKYGNPQTAKPKNSPPAPIGQTQAQIKPDRSYRQNLGATKPISGNSGMRNSSVDNLRKSKDRNALTATSYFRNKETNKASMAHNTHTSLVGAGGNSGEGYIKEFKKHIGKPKVDYVQSIKKESREFREKMGTDIGSAGMREQAAIRAKSKPKGPNQKKDGGGEPDGRKVLDGMRGSRADLSKRLKELNLKSGWKSNLRKISN